MCKLLRMCEGFTLGCSLLDTRAMSLFYGSELGAPPQLSCPGHNVVLIRPKSAQNSKTIASGLLVLI